MQDSTPVWPPPKEDSKCMTFRSPLKLEEVSEFSFLSVPFWIFWFLTLLYFIFHLDFLVSDFVVFYLSLENIS